MENILLTIHLIVATAMVLAILMQRSEGGALGIGGGPTGMMSARGAADFLTRTTKWLAIVFLANSLGLSWLASQNKDNTAALDILEQDTDRLRNLEVGRVTIKTKNPIVIKPFNDVQELGRFVFVKNDNICAGGIIT